MQVVAFKELIMGKNTRLLSGYPSLKVVWALPDAQWSGQLSVSKSWKYELHEGTCPHYPQGSYMLEISFLSPFRTFWMTFECVLNCRPANSHPAPTHSALHVHIWLKTNDSQPETSWSPDSAQCNRFLYLNLEMTSKEGNLMSPRFNNITGCSCQFSHNALPKMRPTVAQMLGLLH